jgi:uncharacterized protein
MRGIRGFILLGLISGLVFAQVRELPFVAALWIVMLLVPLPTLAVVQARHAAEIVNQLPRTRIYIDSIVSLWALALITAVVAWWSRFGLAELGLVRVTPGELAGWTSGLTVAGLLVMAAARAAGARETALLGHLLPGTTKEKAFFVVLSLTAGVCEELIFRGFMLSALHAATGSLTLAVVVSAGAFGVVHAYQQAAGALRAAVLGVLLALAVVYTSSIVPAILAHAALDLIAGLLLRDRLVRSGT